MTDFSFQALFSLHKLSLQLRLKNHYCWSSTIRRSKKNNFSFTKIRDLIQDLTKQKKIFYLSIQCYSQYCSSDQNHIFLFSILGNTYFCTILLSAKPFTLKSNLFCHLNPSNLHNLTESQNS